MFITAFPEEKLRARALQGGAVCFLSKPFQGQVLIDCVATALAPESD
jgi:FixJ family two-component response regulator